MGRYISNEVEYIDEEGTMVPEVMPPPLNSKAVQDAENAIMDDIFAGISCLQETEIADGEEETRPFVFNRLHGWHWQYSGKEKIRAKEEGEDVQDDYYEKKVPYILIRPKTIKMKPEKMVVFQVSVVISKATPTGYYLMMEAVNIILDHFATNYVKPDYILDPDESTGKWDADATIGPYWGYHIFLTCKLAQQGESSILKREFNL
jgi:hypothetical protein